MYVRHGGRTLRSIAGGMTGGTPMLPDSLTGGTPMLPDSLTGGTAVPQPGEITGETPMPQLAGSVGGQALAVVLGAMRSAAG